MSGELIETLDGRVATLTFYRPDRLNALSDSMLAEFMDAIRRLGQSESVGAIVITGSGRGFCAGGDVKNIAAGVSNTFSDKLEKLRWRQQVPVLLRACPKIVIAMVNGVATGAGFGLALACDMRIAARSARFGTAYARVGFSGDFGGSWSLTQLVGPAKARELFFTADIIDAAEAHRLGIITEIADDEQLSTRTMEIAQKFASGPTIAYSYMKRNLFAAETQPLSEILELEALHQTSASLTDDHKEATQAFIEKRKPNFKGR